MAKYLGESSLMVIEALGTCAVINMLLKHFNSMQVSTHQV